MYLFIFEDGSMVIEKGWSDIDLQAVKDGVLEIIDIAKMAYLANVDKWEWIEIPRNY